MVGWSGRFNALYIIRRRCCARCGAGPGERPRPRGNACARAHACLHNKTLAALGLSAGVRALLCSVAVGAQPAATACTLLVRAAAKWRLGRLITHLGRFLKGAWVVAGGSRPACWPAPVQALPGSPCRSVCPPGHSSGWHGGCLHGQRCPCR